MCLFMDYFGGFRNPERRSFAQNKFRRRYDTYRFGGETGRGVMFFRCNSGYCTVMSARDLVFRIQRGSKSHFVLMGCVPFCKFGSSWCPIVFEAPSSTTGLSNACTYTVNKKGSSLFCKV